MKHSLEPVIVDGKVLLYDIYVEGEWIGSRRTITQCYDDIHNLLKREYREKIASIYGR